MPHVPEPDPPQQDGKEPISSHLSSELGALWAFLKSRHQHPDEDAQHLSIQSQSKDKSMDENLTRQDLESRLIAHAWEDEAFKAELLADPNAVIQRELQTYGLTLPDGVAVTVHEETPSQVHLVLPINTAASAESELSDADLDLVAGGFTGEMPTLGGQEDDPTNPRPKKWPCGD